MMDMHKRKCKFYAILSAVLILLFATVFGIAAFAKYSEKVSPNGQMSVTLMTEPGTMLPQNTWYKGSTNKASITKVEFVKKLPEGRNFSEQWDASELQDGRITVAVDGTTLYISSNGADVIYANPDSTEMFGDYDAEDIWSSLETIENASMLDTSKVTSMKDMFTGCFALKSVDVSQWDTSNVTNMSETFMACFALESVDVSGWDTGNVKDMSYIFSNSNYLRPIGIENWDTHNVTSMKCMFMRGISDDVRDDPWTLDLSGWDTSNVTNMESIFSRADIAELNISGWDTSNVTTARSAFESGMTSDLRKITVGDKVGTILLNELPSFNETELEGADGKWYAESDGKGYAPADIPGNKADTYYASASLLPAPTMLPQNTWYKGTIAKSSITEVNFVKELPTGVTYTEQWDASEAQDGSITTAISGTTLYISSNGFNKIMANENSSRMFYNFSKVTSINGLDMLDVSAVTDMNRMFYGCKALKTLDVSGWDTSAVTDMNYMFYDCAALENLDVSGWSTGAVTNMSWMFVGCEALNTLDVSGWDTGKVTNMSSMFSLCRAFETLDVSGWDTSAVTDMSWMFYSCDSLKTLDLSSWNVSNVTNMSYMFFHCILETLDLSNWNVSNVTNMSNMFNQCEALENLDISNWNVSNVTDMSNMFFYCNALTTLDISGWDTGAVSSAYSILSECHNLQKIVVGDNITSTVLKNFAKPSIAYIPGAIGKWYAESDRKGYAPADIPANKADTYYASASLLPTSSSQTTPPTMAAKDILKNGNYTSVEKINFVKELPPECKGDRGWDASEAQDGSIVAIQDGNVLYISSNGADKIMANEDSSSMFAGFSVTSINGLDMLDVSKVTNMSGMFGVCNALETLDLSNWNTSAVTNMNYMFRNCSALTTLDVSGWDTSKVTNSVGSTADGKTMNYMFYGCYNLQKVTVGDGVTAEIIRYNLPAPSATYIEGADGKWYAESDGKGYAPADIPGNKADVYYASAALLPTQTETVLLPGDSWYKSSMDRGTFTEVSFVKELPANMEYSEQWDATEAQNGGITAAVSGTTLYISSNGEERIKANANSSRMFESFTNVEAIRGLEMLDTSSTENIEAMFSKCYKLKEIDISSFDTSNVTNFRYVFYSCQALTSLDLSTFDMSKATDITALVENCTSLETLNIAWNDTSNIVYGGGFYYSYNIREITVSDKVSSVVLDCFPYPYANYIPGADEKWYAASTHIGYSPADIPDNKADTYYASPLLLPANTSLLSAAESNDSTAPDLDASKIEVSSQPSRVQPNSGTVTSIPDSSAASSVPSSSAPSNDSVPDSSSMSMAEQPSESHSSDTSESEETNVETESQSTSESGMEDEKLVPFSSSMLPASSFSTQFYAKKTA